MTPGQAKSGAVLESPKISLGGSYSAVASSQPMPQKPQHFGDVVMALMKAKKAGELPQAVKMPSAQMHENTEAIAQQSAKMKRYTHVWCGFEQKAVINKLIPLVFKSENDVERSL